MLKNGLFWRSRLKAGVSVSSQLRTSSATRVPSVPQIASSTCCRRRSTDYIHWQLGSSCWQTSIRLLHAAGSNLRSGSALHSHCWPASAPIGQRVAHGCGSAGRRRTPANLARIRAHDIGTQPRGRWQHC